MYRQYEEALGCRASKSFSVKSGKFGHQVNSDIHEGLDGGGLEFTIH